MEVMIGAGPAVEVQTRRFLSGFRIIPLTSDVAERAVVLRQRYRVKLPDAVIWASAGVHSMLLVTRNSRSEEHTSELQSLMRISYAVFCWKKKKFETIYHHR